MFAISKVCLIVSVLILALMPVCVHGDKGGETCSGDSAALETGEECVTTRTISENEKHPEQEKIMEREEEIVSSEENTVDKPAKGVQQNGGVDKIKEKAMVGETKPIRKEEQKINLDQAKLVELKRKQMEARLQHEATTTAEQEEGGEVDKATEGTKMNKEIRPPINQKEANMKEPLKQEEHKRKEERSKLVELKREEIKAREQEEKQSEATKVTEERVKQKVANVPEQKKNKANANANKQKPKNTPVRPSTDPERVPSAVNKAIKEDNARSADENEKVHLDIEEFTVKQAFGSSEVASPDVHLAVQVCEDRVSETLILLKSARMLSRVHLHFHVFAEEELKSELEQQLESWPSEARKQTTLDIQSLSFPSKDGKKWKEMERNKTCATQRLFFPDLLSELDAVLYVDTDIVFMRPPEDIWHLFHHFNNFHIAGLTREQEEGTNSWYNRFSRTPYVHPIGVNSGVILMNLTRMRTENWVPAITSYFTQYRSNLIWGDQDLINIFFHFKPEMLFLFQCHWNFRSDHCGSSKHCPPAYKYGANLVHGSRRVYTNDKMPTFKVIYNAFKEHKLGEDLGALLKQLKKDLAANNIQRTRCGRDSKIIIKQLERQVALYNLANGGAGT